MKAYLYTLSLLILVGCATKKDLDQIDETSINVESKNDETVKITATIGEIGESDPITITNARIEGNTMFITVEYSGGCQDHALELIGNMGVMKSLPPKRGIKLIHHSNGDNCRELITHTIEANIEALAYTPTTGSEIMLILDSYGKELKYIYE